MMMRGLLSVVVGVVATACVLRVNNDHGSDGGAAGTGGVNSTTPPPCSAESLSDSDLEKIYEQARANIEAGGGSFDRSAWTDPTQFAAFVKEVYAVAECVEPAGDLPQALHSDDGPDFYCGPGHGLAKLTTPRVSQCMNELCKLHDACYSMCSGPSKGCEWDTNMEPCDAPFLEQIAQCPPEPGTRLASGMVAFMANLFDVGGSFFACGDLTCPQLGELGLGVCSTNPSGSDCTACLGETDLGGLCGAAACLSSPADAVCYAANCPEVSECYGGYGRGVPGGVQPTNPIDDPDSVPWTLVIYRGEIPETKVSGEYWDVDVFGWSPPDPFALVTVASQTGATPSPEDVYKPYWNTDVLTNLSAQSLRDGIIFEVWDEDLTSHDLIGTCHYEMGNDTFNEKLLDASCDTPELAIHFRTVPVQ